MITRELDPYVPAGSTVIVLETRCAGLDPEGSEIYGTGGKVCGQGLHDW